jgi:hypothetical protein
LRYKLFLKSIIINNFLHLFPFFRNSLSKVRRLAMFRVLSVTSFRNQANFFEICGNARKFLKIQKFKFSEKLRMEKINPILLSSCYHQYIVSINIISLYVIHIISVYIYSHTYLPIPLFLYYYTSTIPILYILLTI